MPNATGIPPCPRMWRLLAVLLLAAVLPAVLGVGAGTASTAPSGRVALVGIPGLEWSDLDEARTPNLWKLTATGGAASLSTRAVPPPDRGITCPTAGWLTVSAGQRAGSPGADCTLPPAPAATPGGGGVVPGWAELVEFNRTTGYLARPGLLGQAVVNAGGSVTAIGPGAALAAADTSGNVARYAATVDALTGDLSSALVVMEADQLARAWISLGKDEDGNPIDLPQATRQQAVAAADAQVGRLLDRLPPDTALLLAGVSDTTKAAHLHVALATGQAADGTPYAGYLTASSTRQNALVTLTDTAATALEGLALAVPEGLVGRAWRGGGAAPAATGDRVTELADADLASQVLREVRQPFFIVFVAVQLLFYLFAALTMRRRPGRESAAEEQAGQVDHSTTGASRSRVLVATQVVAVMSGAIAISTFLAQLVPWWSLPRPMIAVIVTILAFAFAITGLAFAGPWRAHVLGPLTVVAGVTSLALLLDVMTGSRLQVNAVTGYEPVTGGRFYGFGNIAFAVFATGTILALAGVAQYVLRLPNLPDRRKKALALAICLGYGGLAIFANGWPSWGADFGGVPAFVFGFAVFILLLSGSRVSIGRLALIAGAGAVLIGAIAVADWMRPVADQTHLAGFVNQVLNGEAWTVIGRKLGAMLGTLGNWQLTPLSLGALAFLFLVLDRPTRWGASALSQAYALAPTLRAGLFGALTCAFAGFLINDSGIAIPAMALTVAVPLSLAASVRALQLARPTTPAPESEPATPTAPPAP